MRRRLSRFFSRSSRPSKRCDHPAVEPPLPPPPPTSRGAGRSSEDWIRSMLDTYGTICSTNDDSEFGLTDLSAAIEHSRRVMDEEKLKFQLLWQPCRGIKLSPETTKISPVSARGEALSAAMVFRDGPLSDLTHKHSTRPEEVTTTAPRVYTVAASPLTHRSSAAPDWPSLSGRDALLLRDPKLSRLLRAHRHSNHHAERPRRRRKALHELSGHKRARSSPEINWGGARPEFAQPQPRATPIASTADTPVVYEYHSTALAAPPPLSCQAATSPSAANISPYAATDSVSPLAQPPGHSFFGLQALPHHQGGREGDLSCKNKYQPFEPLRDLQTYEESVDMGMQRASDARDLSFDALPDRDAASGSIDNNSSVTPVGPRAPLRIDLPSRNHEVDLGAHGYEHVSFLTEGSLGKLHIVRSEDNLLWVAKLVDLAMLRNPAEAAEALLEAELLRRLRHPNIVEYRNSFIVDEHLIIIMEYCVKGDLHSHLRKLKDREDFVQERQVFHWVHGICAGLAHMHLNNVLHCDVKSSNVFLDANSVAKIGDLGIAKEIRRGARALSPLRCPRGTPLYMSPEMCQKAALTERSDCWAVGCILYEICNLHHAFGSNLHVGRSVKDNESVNSGFSNGTFLPGMTHRSDLSIACKRMLKNIKGDLRRIKLQADSSKIIDSGALRFLRPQELHYWSKGSLSFPQILPPQYCPLLNYMVCAMLEPRPADRPTLNEVQQLIEVALEEEDSVPEEGVAQINSRTAPR